MKRFTIPGAITVAMFLLFGCSPPADKAPSEPPAATESDTSEATKLPEVEADASTDATAAGDLPLIATEEELRAALAEKNPRFNGQTMEVNSDGQGIFGLLLNDREIVDISPLARVKPVVLDLSECGITDIGPLAGMQLQALALEKTRVGDISVLKGMPLQRIYLGNSEVVDLSPLEGAPLVDLNLIGTRVTDLSPLAAMRQLKMLWLNDTPVSDISPLATVPLESLTLAGTKVSDLSPLKGTGLQRLHIARTEVTDLTPLEWLNLTRLVFTPGKIEKGIEHARAMTNLREIGTAFGEADGRNDLMPPQAFWPRYDAGEFD